MDADRIATVPGELDGFKKLLEYCRIQNAKGNTPHFIIMDNPDFEYVACIHSPQYRGQDPHKFIESVLGAKSIAAFILKEMQMFITSLIQENCHIRQ